MKKFLACAAIIILTGCTDPSGASKVLRNNGYTNIHIGGYSWFTCGRDDAYSTEFEAVSPSGNKVNGAVCSGLMKGSTIRFF